MDADQLQEYGLIGCFHTCCMMKGEEMAVVTRRLEEVDDDEEDDIVEEFEGITYLELQNSVQNVACQLYYRHGVRRGDKVLIYCGAGGNVGAEIVSIFACISLGVPFVPIVNYTEGTLLQDIVDDASPQAAIVLAAKDSDDIVQALAKQNIYRCVLITMDGSLTPVEAVSTDIPDELPTAYPWSSLSCQLASNSNYDEVHCAPLYIMYTSGSSGKPKGVLGSHHALLNRLSWQYTRFSFDYNEVVIRRTPLSFIDSIVEIIGSVLGLVPIYAPPFEVITNYGIYGLIDACNDIGVTRITLLPTQLDLLFKLQVSHTAEELHHRWSSLKYVVVSGSPCSLSLVKEFKKMLPFAYLINLYGSTEVAGDVLYAVLCVPDDADIADSAEDGVFTNIIGDEIPIGIPMSNTVVYVRGLDDEVLVTDDAEGVLLCGGAHVAFGYNDTSLNGKFLLSNPYDPSNELNQRLFYTGDMVAKSSENGAFYWKGRAGNSLTYSLTHSLTYLLTHLLI
jgi:acyl-coenzyme A synthetase/AMP-(fatty) acid ligase